MEKKSEVTLDTTAVLIYTIVGVLVLVVFLAFLQAKTAKTYDKAACQLSVVANSKVRFPITNQDLWTVECPTRYIRFTEKGYNEAASGDENDAKFTSSKSYLNSCEEIRGGYEECQYLEQINKEITTRIFDCWEQFLGGQLSLFSSYNVDRQCVVCSVIEFSPEVRDRFGEVYASDILPADQTLDEYMRTHNPIGRDITYYEYVQDDLDHFNPEYYDYNFGYTYAIVFKAVNQHYLETLGEYIMDEITPSFLEIENEGETERFINTLHFIEQQEVSNECDVLAN